MARASKRLLALGLVIAAAIAGLAIRAEPEARPG